MYVGCAQRIDLRWASHRYLLKNGKHDQPLLQVAWDTDGADAFEFQVLEPVNLAGHQWDFGRALRNVERQWLRRLTADGAVLYNKTLPGAPIPPDDEMVAFSVRMPGWVYNKIALAAEAEDRALNAQVVRILREWAAEQKA